MESFQIRKLKKGVKFELIILLGIIFIILIFLVYSFFLFFSFRTGNFVFKKTEKETLIGQIEGISLSKFGYLIKWNNKNYTEESFFNLKKLENFETDKEITESYIYPYKGSEGTGIVLGDFEDSGNIILPTETSKGIFYNLMISENCESFFVCNKWSECETKYNVEDLLKEKEVYGKKYRYCIDSNKCIPNFFEYADCSKKIPIKSEKIKWCNENYVEIRDEYNNLLVRVKTTNNTLDMNFIVSGEGYCEYCHDNIKNYDEIGVDCGGSCEDC